MDMPRNCQFEVANFEEEILFPGDSFHFIRISDPNGSFTDGKSMVSEAYRVLAPGGYLEIVQTDFDSWRSESTTRSAWQIFGQMQRERARVNGKIQCIEYEAVGIMSEVGFCQIHQHSVAMPASTFRFDIEARVLPLLDNPGQVARRLILEMSTEILNGLDDDLAKL